MNKLLIFAGLLACGILSPASAETLGWAADGTTPWSGGTGTWQVGGPSIWSPGSGFVPWSNGNIAKFEGAAGTVTVTGGVSADAIIIKNTGGYLFTGSAITITGGLMIEGEHFTGTNTINNNIVLTATDPILKVYDYDGSGGTLIFNGEISFSGGGNHWLKPNAETAGDRIVFNGALGNDSTSGITTLEIGTATAHNNATYELNASSSGFDGNDFVVVGKGNVLIGNGAAVGGARFQIGSNLGSGDTASVRTTNATTVAGRIELVNGNVNATYTVGTTATDTTTFSGEINLYDGRNLTIEAAAGSVVDFSNQITNSGGLIKNGAGTAILSRTAGNSFSGTITVNGGTLLVNNGTSSNGTGGGAVNVESGARFGGAGHINTGSTVVTVKSGGTFVAGDGLTATSGFLMEGYLTLQNDAHIALVLGSGGTASYLTRVWGGATWNFGSSQIFDLTFTDGAGVGTYNNIIRGLSSDPGMTGWSFSNGIEGFFSYSGGNVSMTITAIPEASTGLMAAACVLCVFIFRRRFKPQSILSPTACSSYRQF